MRPFLPSSLENQVTFSVHLRSAVSRAHLAAAHDQASQGHFAEARQHYEACLTFSDVLAAPPVLARWGITELKAGDEAAT